METTTTPKRKYQKHKTEGKITVKHYLNTKLKPNVIGGKEYFPVYVYLMVKGQLTQFKSKYNGLITKEDFENNNFPDETIEELKQEIERIINIIKYLKPFENEGFKVTNFTEFYNNLSENFYLIIDKQLKLVVWVELDQYLIKIRETQSNLEELPDRVFRGINWNCETEMIIFFINLLLPDFVKKIKDMFKTSYLFDLKSLNTPPKYEYTGLTLADFQLGKYSKFVLDHLGEEVGKAFLEDITKVLQLNREHLHKNLLDNCFIL